MGENIFREGKKRRQVRAGENILKYILTYNEKLKDVPKFLEILKYILNILGLEEDIF